MTVHFAILMTQFENIFDICVKGDVNKLRSLHISRILEYKNELLHLAKLHGNSEIISELLKFNNNFEKTKI